jgi:hypothetical protein
MLDKENKILLWPEASELLTLSIFCIVFVWFFLGSIDKDFCQYIITFVFY